MVGEQYDVVFSVWQVVCFECVKCLQIDIDFCVEKDSELIFLWKGLQVIGELFIQVVVEVFGVKGQLNCFEFWYVVMKK